MGKAFSPPVSFADSPLVRGGQAGIPEYIRIGLTRGDFSASLGMTGEADGSPLPPSDEGGGKTKVCRRERIGKAFSPPVSFADSPPIRVLVKKSAFSGFSQKYFPFSSLRKSENVV